MVSREEKTGRLIYFALAFLLIVVGIGIRCSTHGSFTLNFFGHFNFFDPDGYYYLRRLAHFLQNFPSALHWDPLLKWPAGGGVDWPDGALWLYGLPLFLLRVDSFHGLELGSSILSVLYGSLLSIFVFLLSKRFFSKPYQLLALFLAGISPLLVRYSCLGIVDHHIFEAMTSALTILLVLKAFEDKSFFAAMALGSLWAFSFSISSSSIFTVGIGLISILVVFGRSIPRSIFWTSFASFLFTFGFVLLWHQHRWMSAFDMKMPSLFQLSLVSSLFCFVGIGLFFKGWRSALACRIGVVIAIGLSVIFVPAFQKPLLSAFRYVFLRPGMLQHVIEANPVWSRFGEWGLDFAFANLGFLVPLLLLAPLGLFYWKRLSKSERYLLVFFLLMMIPGLMQRRFLQLFVPVYLIGAVWLLYQLHLFLKAKNLRLSFITGLGFAALMLLPSIKYGFAPSLENSHRVDFSIAGLFLKETQLSGEPAWKRLGGKEESPGGIWAPPNMGHLLSYLTGYGNMLNVFYFTSDVNRDSEIRSTKTLEELKTILQSHRASYAIVVNDFAYYEMLRGFVRKPTDDFIEYQDGKKIFRLDKMEEFAWVRLILRPDEEWKGVKEIFAASIVEDYFYNAVRAFEIPYEN